MAAEQHTRVSRFFTDPFVRLAFERIEKDAPGALLNPPRPKPTILGGAAVAVEA